MYCCITFSPLVWCSRVYTGRSHSVLRNLVTKIEMPFCFKRLRKLVHYTTTGLCVLFFFLALVSAIHYYRLREEEEQKEPTEEVVLTCLLKGKSCQTNSTLLSCSVGMSCSFLYAKSRHSWEGSLLNNTNITLGEHYKLYGEYSVSRDLLLRVVWNRELLRTISYNGPYLITAVISIVISLVASLLLFFTALKSNIKMSKRCFSSRRYRAIG